MDLSMATMLGSSSQRPGSLNISGRAATGSLSSQEFSTLGNPSLTSCKYTLRLQTFDLPRFCLEIISCLKAVAGWPISSRSPLAASRLLVEEQPIVAKSDGFEYFSVDPVYFPKPPSATLDQPKLSNSSLPTIINAGEPWCCEKYIASGNALRANTSRTESITTSAARPDISPK